MPAYPGTIYAHRIFRSCFCIPILIPLEEMDWLVDWNSIMLHLGLHPRPCAAFTASDVGPSPNSARDSWEKWGVAESVARRSQWYQL